MEKSDPIIVGYKMLKDDFKKQISKVNIAHAKGLVSLNDLLMMWSSETQALLINLDKLILTGQNVLKDRK